MAKKGFSNILLGIKNKRIRRRPSAQAYEVSTEFEGNQEIPQSEDELEEIQEQAQERELTIIPSETTNDAENNKVKSGAKNLAKAMIIKRIRKKIIRILIILTGIFVIMILPAVISIGIKLLEAYLSSENNTELSYYTSKCREVTVVFVDKANNYAPTGTQTYPLEEYVAGVISAEVGMFSDAPEVLKTFAVAARSFVITASDSNCTIEASARKQAFRDLSESTNAEIYREAANATAGEVLLKNGEVFQAQYDAFAVASVDSNYYTLKQANQKIPVSWVESHISQASLNFYANANHGRGMSQWGSYYLAKEENYTYKDIINFYYQGQDVQIGVRRAAITSIANLDIKTTTDAKSTLIQPIGQFLASHNDSLENYNNYIKSSVESVGAGTRAGVVTAAVSMINYLYDNYNMKLPYYWGGGHNVYGLPSSIGTQKPSVAKKDGSHDYYVSFDCSGFVSWAIKNGGYKFTRTSTMGFDSMFSKDSCVMSDPNCIGEPGDLINSRDSHVQLIVSVVLDEKTNEPKSYIIAESAYGVVVNQAALHPIGTAKKILRMESFYSNPDNIDPNY